MSKYYISFKGLKPLDMVVFLGLNILVGGYIWTGYVQDMKLKEFKEREANAVQPAVENDSIEKK